MGDHSSGGARCTEIPAWTWMTISSARSSSICLRSRRTWSVVRSASHQAPVVTMISCADQSFDRHHGLVESTFAGKPDSNSARDDTGRSLSRVSARPRADGTAGEIGSLPRFIRFGRGAAFCEAGRSRRYSLAIARNPEISWLVCRSARQTTSTFDDMTAPDNRQLGDPLAGQARRRRRLRRDPCLRRRRSRLLPGCRTEPGDAAEASPHRRVGRAPPASRSPVRGGSGCDPSIPRPISISVRPMPPSSAQSPPEPGSGTAGREILDEGRFDREPPRRVVAQQLVRKRAGISRSRRKS